MSAVAAWAERLTDGPITRSVLELAATMAAQHGDPWRDSAAHRDIEEPPMPPPNPKTTPQRMATAAACILRERGEVLTVDLTRAGFTDVQIRRHGADAIATAVQRTGAVVLDRAA